MQNEHSSDHAKGHRNRQSVDVVSSTAVRAVDPEEYANARGREMTTLVQRIGGDGKSGVKRVFQTLPRDMRRRSMSHNVRRLPLRLQAAAAHEMEQSAKLKPTQSKKSQGEESDEDGEDDPGKLFTNRKSRYHRRRRGGDTADVERRSREGKVWLETHYWHAKRMHMSDLFGFRLAITPTNRSMRALYRAVAHTATLHDASYYGTLELHGSMENLQRLLLPFLNSECLPLYLQRALTSRAASVELYNPNSHGLLGPACVLWIAEDRLLISAHPICFDLLLSLLAGIATVFNVQVHDRSQMLGRLELRGPQVHQLLRSVVTLAHESTAAQTAWRHLKDLQSCASLSSNVVLGIEVQDPRLRHPVDKPNSFFRAAAQTAAVTRTFVSTSTTAAPAISDDFENLLAAWPSNVSQSSLWNPDTVSALVSNMPSVHSLNMRRQQQLVPQELDFISDQDVIVPLVLIQQAGYRRTHTRRGFSTSTPKEPPSGFNSGWDIVMPRCMLVGLWHALVHCGLQVTGQQERDEALLEAREPRFPQDYPTCDAARELLKHAGDDALAKHLRKPAGKRANFEALSTSHPFAPDWLNLSPTLALQHVKLTMIGAGLPEANAMIAFPTAEDLEQIATNFKDKARLLVSCDAPTRTVIGYITSGGFVYSCGGGFGVGSITVDALRQLQTQQSGPPWRVLVRNPSSSQFRVAECSA